MESVGASLVLKASIAKKRNVSMIVQGMGSVRIINVYAPMDISERIAPYMNALITVQKMDHAIVKQESAHVTMGSSV